MSTVVVTTFSGSTYTLRVASEVPGRPVTVQHRRDASTPPEALLNGGMAVNARLGFRFDRMFDKVVLVVPGLIQHTPVERITVDGITIPVGS